MSVSVGQLISGIRGLPEETRRKMAAVIGAVVADAASLPLQWIYDDKVVAQCAMDGNDVVCFTEDEGHHR